MITQLEVRNTCREFGLALDSDQQQRVARGYDIFHRGLVHKAEHQVSDYDTYFVGSQYRACNYTVRYFPRFETVTCECPDFRKGWASTGLHAGPTCKHCVAVLIQREMDSLLLENGGL